MSMDCQTCVAADPPSAALLTKDELQKQVSALRWVHQIDLGQGVVTPGRWEPHPLIAQAFDTIDFRGKKVLDIGCWDGLWSFEAEKRGAREVYATDYATQREYNGQPTFLLAHQALRSKVNYHPRVSVFDIESLGVHDFDVVVFCGVYYHLRDPLKALATLRKVMKTGGTIIVEGDAIFNLDQSIARFYYRDRHFGDASNWWVPSKKCLVEWVESSFFAVQREFAAPRGGSLLTRFKRQLKRLSGGDTSYVSRLAVTAQAVERADPNYAFPDDDFRQCDLNHYS